ncbi:hypothetical protein [Calothrix sp. PCC 7507]|uniref:hypothetical protein n=1 Tax=Calothrix sp. PCC 7507 TaxID=99598 RepID=UPI00029EF7EC|nr:hypothetical protein [Calothrix sp. PCC 7507]AFY32939.1 hypothetical protein Cal7507_2510 [Calothrix sp. PCC 7507]
MNIVKLILLACPVFLASVLMLANPAQALGIKSAPATQQLSDLVTPTLAATSNAIVDQLGCNCANCVQSKFHLLQGNLPSMGF